MLVDRELRYVFVNEWMAARTGRRVEEFLGRTVREVFPVEADEFEPIIRRVLETGATIPQLENVTGPPEDRSYFWSSYYPFRSPDGEVVGVSMTGQDVTERRRAEEALKESERRLRLMSDNLPVLVAVVDRELRYQFTSRGYEEQFRIPVDEIRGRHVRDVVGDEIFERVRPYVERALAGEPVTHEADLPLPNGPLHVRTILTPIFDERGNVTGVHATVQDISDIYQAEVELRELAGRLITAQEEERSRLARELHDDLTQRLASLAIDVGALTRDLELPDDRPVRRIHDQLVELSTGVRMLARRLHPSILDDLGLVDAVRAECAALTEREGIDVVTRLGALPAGLSDDVLLALYRIAQEALRNLTRHARVDTASLELVQRDGSIVLSVEDQGVGFEPTGVHGSGLGLESMRERMRALGGELRLESRPGGGTRVEARVPLS